MVNTILSPCASGLLTFIIRKRITGQHTDIRLDFNALTNGVLAGCVSITASCGYVDPWCAIVIGIIGSFFYSYACLVMDKLEIDDPLEAFQVHGCCGFWGCIALALFHSEKGLLVSKDENAWKFLGYQLLGTIVIMAWSGILSFIYFIIWKKFFTLRLSEEVELLGGDIYYFGPI